MILRVFFALALNLEARMNKMSKYFGFIDDKKE